MTQPERSTAPSGKHDGEQRETGELQADRGEELEEQDHDQTDPEGGRRDDECELDHGENR